MAVSDNPTYPMIVFDDQIDQKTVYDDQIYSVAAPDRADGQRSCI